MFIPINKEFIDICKEIKSKELSANQWAEIESDDMFQCGSYVGGFDADEMEFCFSYYGIGQAEYWFQLGLSKIKEIADGKYCELTGQLVE